MIAIIDTGGANLSSVRNALDRLDQPSTVTKDADVIRQAERVILPGVGAAKDSMKRIENADLVDVIRQLKQPVLGICLGMQLLFERSEEGDTPCLGVIPGMVRKIPRHDELSLPHMGWNRLRLHAAQKSPLLHRLREGDWFYFVHSYYGEVNEYTLSVTDYGTEIAAIVHKDNFYGTQFHPEKSAGAGTQILRNFISL
jgi:glutamine amidotransferase